MSGGMVERVTRALDEATEKALATHGRFDTRDMAKTAILAMRDPSEEMVRAAGEPVTSSLSAFWPRICREVWQAMIDAAISEG